MPCNYGLSVGMCVVACLRKTEIIETRFSSTAAADDGGDMACSQWTDRQTDIWHIMGFRH